MDPALTMTTAFWRMTGEVWSRQLRCAQVFYTAAWRQNRVFWGLAHPATVHAPPVSATPPRAAAKPARRPVAEPDMNDVPV